MKRIIFFITLLLGLGNMVLAQNARELVKWKVTLSQTAEQQYQLAATAAMTGKWYLYAQDPGGDGSLLPPSVRVLNSDVKVVSPLTEVGKPKTKYIEELEYSVNYFSNNLTLNQTISVPEQAPVHVVISYMTCDEETQVCLAPVEDTLTLVYNTASNAYEAKGFDAALYKPTSDNEGDANAVTTTEQEAAQDRSLDVDTALETKSLLDLFIAGLIAGFIAFIMPCVYAMLPITVSFFTKRSKDRATGIKNAFIYSLSIIAVFVAIGGLISLLFGPKTMYELSTSIGFNLFVFVIFVVFGLSLLGAFEITLPSSWNNKLDSKANTNSVGGIFFMALVLVVVSFSCTSAFISSLIVYIISSGNSLGGVIGFLGFGVALALPFSIFALFPSLLNNVAKSGGWLNAVKVTMGFIELAMALKFLSNVDLQYHWGILDFDVYLSLWIAIFGALTLYLFGFIRFSHDGDLPQNLFGKPYLSVTRTLFALTSLAFTMYLIPGLWGAPLTAVSGFLPERKTLEFNIHDKLTEIHTNTNTTTNLGDHAPKKYTNILHSEFPGINTYFDYEEALAASKALKKPLLVDFTGHSCVNCRKMERTVLSKPQILKRLKEEFLLVSLYCDDKTPLAPEDVVVTAEGKTLKTIGDKNLDIQLNKYQAVAQPYYVFVDGDANNLIIAGGYDPDIERFNRILDEALLRFKQQNP